MIAELSDKQEDIREIIVGARESQDKTMDDGILSALGYDDDTIIAVVLAKLELHGDGAIVDKMDLMWASAFMDHLDTLGYQITRKP